MAKSSNIILARNMKPDRAYVNVLSISDAAMLAAVQGNAAATANNYTFIREERNTIKVNLPYSTCLTCNYMAFQNPDYSNKWFFAWIDSVEYVGENTVRLRFTVDIWSTWHNKMNWLPVFVEREHVNDDSFGVNNLPEPVRPDKMITNFTVYKRYTNFKIVVFYMNAQVSSDSYGYGLNGIYNTPVSVNQYNNGITGISDLLADLANSGSLANAQILSVHMVPIDFIPAANRNSRYLPLENTTTIDNITMPSPTTLNGYTPVNKKLLTYPYNYIAASNGNSEKIYKYEKFALSLQGAGTFKIVGGVVPNGGATCYPMGYDGLVYENVPESQDIGDMPMMPINTDSYAAWLAQKSSGTVMQGILSTLAGALAGGLKGGLPGAAIGAGTGLIGGVANYIGQSEAARAENDRVTGSNNATIDMVQGLMGYTFCQKCMVADDAARVDNFFSQFGYNVSTVKVPNYTGRTYWNYVKINGSAGYGAMPESAREEINNILNKGTTLWHSHSNMGNYFAGGAKMQNPII